jgi:hypothetical protein
MIGLLAAVLLQVPDAKGVEFFEKRIRPIFAEHCASCHSSSAKNLKGGLLLDSREDILKGGDSGPAVSPGAPEKSLLLKAVRWIDEDLRMPPKKQLPAEALGVLEDWIRRGAPAPVRVAPTARKTGMSLEEGRKFWSYRPIAKGGGADVDALIQAKLDAAGLARAPEAGRAELLRRLTFDLHGLPPTPEELDAFEAKPDTEAVVDRLLASPRFGERWGRHWLDVARFAESLTLRGFILKDAWRYRDYVVGAFHADLPFADFVREQLAGDLIPGGTLEERRRRLAAVMFLTLGNTNLEEQDKKQLEMDVVDEQLDVVTRGFLGQTVACARCHDHKFDPIPTRDYYALAGILRNARVLEHANVSKWLEVALPAEPAVERETKEHDAAVAALEERLKALKAKSAVATRAAAEKAKGVIAVKDVPGIVVDDAKAEKAGAWQDSTYSGVYIGAGYTHDRNERKGECSLTFQPELAAGRYEVRFAYSPGASRSDAVPVTILSAEGEKTVRVNLKEVPPIGGRFVSLGVYRFENNQGYVIVSNEGTQGHVTADAMVFLPVDRVEQSAADDQVKALEAELKRLKDGGPRRERVMALQEERKPADVRVHVRGSVHTLGELAPRGVLQVVPAPAPAMPSDQSGRLQLAEWIVSPANPLAARVYVNRVWHWLFGAGLVRTTDNFGTTGEGPSHPELLDALAARFLEEGGSTKKLVRRLVLSRTYRSSTARSGGADPENRLLRHANRRRLDAEALRDAMLAVSGRLDLAAGGPSFPEALASDYAYRHEGGRRSVYVPVFRNALPELFQVFDFADPSMTTGRRDVSTVAPQALFLLNNPFVRAQAAAAAERLLAEPHADDAARIVRAWRLALGRPPSEAEAAIARRAVGSPSGWPALFHGLFCSVDFRYVE